MERKINKKEKKQTKVSFPLKDLSIKTQKRKQEDQNKKKKPKEENLGIRVHLKEYPVPAQKAWTEGPEAL